MVCAMSTMADPANDELDVLTVAMTTPTSSHTRERLMASASAIRETGAALGCQHHLAGMKRAMSSSVGSREARGGDPERFALGDGLLSAPATGHFEP
jgi:hypothetical protein